MPPLLDELWVFSKAGVPVVDFSKEGGVDKTFLGFFISAIQTFSQQASGRTLRGFTIGNNKYTCTQTMDDQIILVCRSPLDVNKKKIQKICRIIGKIFDDMFKIENITGWDGDISYFDSFRTKLDIYFKMGEL